MMLNKLHHQHEVHEENKPRPAAYWRPTCCGDIRDFLFSAEIQDGPLKL